MRKFVTKVVNEWLTINVPCCPVCGSINNVRLLIVERCRTVNFFCVHCDVEFDYKHIYLPLQDGSRRLIA